MNVPRKNSDGQSVILFIFSGETCFFQKREVYPQEEVLIEIGGISDLSETVVFTFRTEGRSFLINGRLITNGGYCFVQNRRNETVLLVPVYSKNILGSCDRIYFTKEIITIGSGYGQDIFYEYASFGREAIGILRKERNGYVIKSGHEKEESFRVGIYVNGAALHGEMLLSCGDRITFMGLSLLILKEMLLCTVFFGKLRVTEADPLERERKQALEWQKKESIRKPFSMEELTEALEPLHTGEVELELPEAVRKEQSQPLFLTLGPSLTMLFPAILMAALGSVAGQSSYYLITAAMTGASAVLSLFWGLMNHGYRRHMAKQERKQRIEEYHGYLQERKEYLTECMEQNRAILLQGYPHYSSFFSEDFRVIRVCERRERQEDGQEMVRLGLGEIPFQMTLKLQGKRGFEKDELVKEAWALCDTCRKLAAVPVGVSLLENSFMGFAGAEVFPIVLQFLVQIAAGCHHRKLKIIYFYHWEYPEEAKLAECLKWLPHVWSEDRKVRFLAGNKQQAEVAANELERLWRRKKETGSKVRYLLLIANPKITEGAGFWDYLQSEKEASLATICYVSRRKEQLPGHCSCRVLQEQGEIRYQQKKTYYRQQVVLEKCDDWQAQRYMRRMWGFSAIGEERREIGGQVSFLELYACDRVEELDCGHRWKEHLTKERMRVPIGLAEGGKRVCLDIHEKFHGPHGLVAGTTGAGKSELLQTYLLSLAVSFSPEDVSFFIIDYKGGGMGDVLKTLPHCSGSISNLSGRQIKRALRSIKSENLRRQSLFSHYQVSHIEEYKELYREGVTKEPVPHLLLVVDEFAELKKEEPEFMQEIISVSQVGRSLGVHLILATQKPAGCVDDKIWSNTRFRLCLRVADTQDSMDMLHRREAAYLTGAGKGYLQVGNDELFLLFQAGYCKADYLPGHKSHGATSLLSVTGQRMSLQRETSHKQKRQLECIREYLQETARRGGFQSARELWMPELPEQITRYEAAGDEKGICIGLCDDPGRQKQYPVFYRPQHEGHFCLCGGPATGKSTFLQLVLWQLCTQFSPEEVQFLLAASDAAGVSCFEEMPHCLGNMKEERDGECFFYHLEQFMEQRKALLEGMNLEQYQKRQSKKLPILFFVIDNYGAFRKMTSDAYEEIVEKIAREGLNYGIYLMITALGAGGSELPARLFEKIKTTMTLELSDSVMYGDVLRRYRIGILPVEGCKGRGLCKVGEEILEIQVPLVSSQDDYGRIEEVKAQSMRLKSLQNQPCKFPFIPFKQHYEELHTRFFLKKGRDCGYRIPLGYRRQSGEVEELLLQPGKSFVITGLAGGGKRSLLAAFIYSCIQQEIQLLLFDKRKEIAVETSKVSCAENVEEWNCFRKNAAVVIITNLADFAKEIPFEEKMPCMLVLSRAEEELSLSGNPWYEYLAAGQLGICLGGNAGSQRLLRFEDLSYEHMSRSKPPGWGFYKAGAGAATRLLYLPELSVIETGGRR